ncbi:MAG: uracil-DNA glycosylase [Candidatus Riflebacteria bacterium]|nr:uracil-DNA glycosylase [Candidatus Riflebacteria bacterium]MBR4569991.1 uracil-DNA glycosylase [Candidatus Riflebacteria bacterium]
MPENADSYEVELSVPDQDIDLIALGKEELALAKSSASVSKTTPTTPTTPSTPTTLTTQTKIVAKPQQTQTKTVNILTPIQGFENDSFEQIIKDIQACQLCGLCKTRKNVVPGVGNEHAKLVLIGEAPGADEDIQGIPFVGKAGKHLDKILAAAGFKKEDLYICNILKCRPPNNRDPNLSEMKVCTPYLQRQLALIKPKLIGCLGNISAHYVISPSIPGITRIRGQWFNSIFGIPAFAMYHPSYLIRSESREKGSPNWQMWQDIRALKAKYDSL